MPEHETTTNQTTTNEPKNRTTNPLQANAVSDEYRAQLLEKWVKALGDCFEEIPLLMPLTEDKKPLTVQMGSIEAAESNLVEPTEAARRIREDGADGFYVYAGNPDHRTENLLIHDHDDLDEWPADSHEPTVRVMSGSGSAHNYYQNDSNDRVRNADLPDGGGEIQAHNRGVVVPGSVHESGGIYHMTQNPGFATLADSDLGEAERPKTRAGPIPKDISDHDFSSDDMETVVMVRGCVGGINFSSHPVAHQQLQELKEGKYRKQGYTSKDGSADRSRAELALFMFVYGAVLDKENVSEQRASEATGEYLTHKFNEMRTTEDGQVRKWLMRTGRYRDRIAAVVQQTYDRHKWAAWRGATNSHRHPLIYKYLLEAVNADSMTNLDDSDQLYDIEEYPDGRRVQELARSLNPKDLTLETYRRALIELRDDHEKVKMASMPEPNDYRYYPAIAPDPPDAEFVKIGGERCEPESESQPEASELLEL